MRGIDPVFVNAWLSETGASWHTMRLALYNMKLFDRFLRGIGKDFLSVEASDIESFARSVLEEHPASVASNALGTVKRFYRWAEESGIVVDVAKTVVLPEAFENYARPPEPVERVKLLFSHARDSRDLALLSLMARAALEVGEIRKLNVGGVVLRDGAGVLKLGAGRNAVLTSACARDLEGYIADMGPEVDPEAPLFASRSKRNAGERLTVRALNHMVEAAMKGAGVRERRHGRYFGGSAVELAVEEGEPAETILRLAYRTHKYGKKRECDTWPIP